MSPASILRLALLLAAAITLLLPSTALAETPQEQLAALAKRVDAATARLDAGDVSGARAEYQAFNDGWFAIEDGVRAQSKASYRAIEEAMDEVKVALRSEPVDPAKAKVALARLRAECDAFIRSAAGGQGGARASMPQAIAHLDLALSALDAGDTRVAAAEIAAFKDAWLDVEGLVKAKSPQTYATTENNMTKASALLAQQPPDARGARETIATMRRELAPFAQGDTQYGIFDAAIILFREGLEALLVVGALLAFLAKTGNAAKGGWIWGGAGAGVALSIGVAFVVNTAFASVAVGTNREILEGIVGLVAAVLLVYVSYWLHSKASLSAWQRYIRDKVSSALARNSLLSLSLVSFFAVFREGAETVLFYAGIAPSIAVGDLLVGLGAGVLGLSTIGVLLLAFSLRLPIRLFFTGASILIYYLAFKFIGNGIHALQLAGVVPATPSPYLPDSGFFGSFPTWETTLPQLTLLVAAAVLLALERSRATPRAGQSGRAAA